MKIKASRLLTTTRIQVCLPASQVQHFADDKETHTETKHKNKHILEIQESTWKTFFFLILEVNFSNFC